MQLIILNEKLEELDKINSLKGFKSINKIYSNVSDIEKDNKLIFNNMDYGVAIFSPTEDLTDFYVIFLNDKSLKVTPYSEKDVKGVLASDLFLTFDKNGKFLKIMKDVYNTNIPQQIYFEYYDKDIICRRLNLKITKINNFIYILGKNEIDYNILTTKQNKIFEKCPEAIIILQDNEIVKYNEKYLKIDKNIYEEIFKKEAIQKNIDNIIQRKSYSYTVPYEINNEDISSYYNIIFNFILYDNQPAAMMILDNINKENLNNKEIQLNKEVLNENEDLTQSITNKEFFKLSDDIKLSEEIEKENKLQKALDISKQLSFSFKTIQGISKLSMYYYNHETNEYTWYNEGYNIFGLDPSKYSGNMEEYIVDKDKNIWKEKHKSCTPYNPKVSFVQRAYSAGKLRYIKTYVAYQFDKNGNKKAHISLFQDITELADKSNELQKALDEAVELRDNLNRIQKTSKTAITYANNLNDVIWTPEIFNILEVNPEDYKDRINHILDDFILEEDKEDRQNNISKLSPANPEITYVQRVKTGKGNIKYIRTAVHRDYDNNGKLIKRIGLNQDITEEIEYQKQLEKALEEKTILSNNLKDALKDKEVLLSEVHHRVKNNLQIVLSLIHLNTNFDKDHEIILQNTQDRIYAMALIHEKIYGSDSLSEVNMKEYIESLVSSLFDTYDSDINFQPNIDPIELTMEQSIPLGLIINELVTNTIKYAFPDKKEGNLYIEFKKEQTIYTLIFQDDGIGLPDDFDLDNLTSLGLIVITNLTQQIGGKITILNGDGTGYKIEFEDN